MCSSHLLHTVYLQYMLLEALWSTYHLLSRGIRALKVTAVYDVILDPSSTWCLAPRVFLLISLSLFFFCVF